MRSEPTTRLSMTSLASSGRHARDLGFLVITHIAGLPVSEPRRGWLCSGSSPCSSFRSSVPCTVSIGRRHTAYVQNVLIVGSGHVAHLIADKIDEALRVRPPRRRVRRPRRPRLCRRRGRQNCSWSGRPTICRARPRARGPPRDLRVLYRLARADARGIRAMRDLDVQIDIVPRILRGLRGGRRGAHARGDPAGRTPADAALAARRGS